MMDNHARLALLFHFLVLHQNLWVNRMELSNWETGLRPDGFIALAPIPKKKVGGGVMDADRPIFGLGPWVGARVGSHRSPILRPGRESL